MRSDLAENSSGCVKRNLNPASCCHLVPWGVAYSWAQKEWLCLPICRIMCFNNEMLPLAVKEWLVAFFPHNSMFYRGECLISSVTMLVLFISVPPAPNSVLGINNKYLLILLIFNYKFSSRTKISVMDFIRQMTFFLLEWQTLIQVI